MEDLLARERAAEQRVQYFLKNRDEPREGLLQAFVEYRLVCEESIFADFEHEAARINAALWLTHTEGKKFFHRDLSGCRQRSNEPVAERQSIKYYLHFLKESMRFYGEYIYKLSITFGGIPELEAVARKVRPNNVGESSQPTVSPELREKALYSCHHALIYLGDLSRYRASEKLDKEPDFGPAIGYYRLACTLRPSSGMGHHQQAVIALEQRNHMPGIYHLYRAIVVEDPHPNAADNLKLEFDKTNAAWDRGDLIQKGAPNDPESSKRTLVGWFVRLHSMCFKGEPFRGYEELEREVLGQLGAELKQRALDATLTRMIMTNLAAQYNAAESFQANPIQQNQNAFLHYFRFNIKTFTTLLRVFYDNLRTVDVTMAEEDDDIQLATRLTELAHRVLPALRLYSAWLLPTTHLLEGLATDDLLKDAIDQFWPIYAKAVDLVAAIFQIWDLEDLPEITYMLEEDAETLEFKPLMNEKTNKIWIDKKTGATKPRFSDRGVKRASADDEMLARIKAFLADGLYLANDDDTAPIKLRGTRILHRDAEEPETHPPLPIQSQTSTKAPSEQGARSALQAKPRTYAAAAAANGSAKSPARTSVPNGVFSSSSTSRHAQLSRMVDDLVDDDDGNNPVTPPQQHASNPAVVTKGDVSYSVLPGSTPDFAKMPSYSYQAQQKPIGSGPSMGATPPTIRTPKNTVSGTSMERLQSVSNLWNTAPAQQSSTSSRFPVGLPTGTLGSPAHMNSRGHSRVNSASSIRSRTSQNVKMGIADSWSSIESAPRATLPNGLAPGFGTPLAGMQQSNVSNVASPLLFGAGGSVWSTSPTAAYRNVSPPNGQGG